MKKLLGIMGVIGVAVVAMVIGCGKEKPVVTDEEAIQTIVDSDDYFNLTRGDDTDHADTTGSKDSLLGNPLWWRKVTDKTKQRVITVVGDSAYVERTIHRTGLFRTIGRVVDDSTGDTTWFDGKKPLGDTLRMRATFKRTGDNAANDRGWRLKKLSGAYGWSDNYGNDSIVHTVRIDSIRIQSTSYPDTMLKNPLETLFNKENVMTFAPAENITVTLYTNVTDGEAYLHVFQTPWPGHYRILMASNGNGSYTNATPWHAQLIQGVRFAFFDLMKYGTIHDTVYPYDFDGWLYPYRVK
ncbi:MAG: hypothetical protein HY769_09615 [Candidatus Stahlbacteria bacterium]|nr:hypothetical protein [Candidatus Stahlbacteria bacterium]